MRESELERDLRLWCKDNGVLCKKFTPMGEVGYPDRIFLYRGRAMFIELKATGKRPRPLQAERIRELREYGFKAECYDNLEDAITSIQSALFPSGWNPLGDQPSLRGIPLGSGAGEDDDHVLGIYDSTAGRHGAEDVGGLPPEARVQRLASAERYVG